MGMTYKNVPVSNQIYVLEQGWWSDPEQVWIFEAVGASKNLTALNEVWDKWEHVDDGDVVYRRFVRADTGPGTHYRIRILTISSSLLDIG